MPFWSADKGLITIAKPKYTEWLTPDGLLRIEGWARDGLNDEEIARKMDINVSTLYKYQAEHNEICEALKKGKAPVDTQVENATLKSALGHIVKVKKPIKIKEVRMKVGEGRIETERIEYVEEEVYIPPNVTAQIFWLKNRRRDKWRDRVNDQQDGADASGTLASILQAVKDID